VKHFSENVSIPVIASSGAGKVEHFSEVFEKTMRKTPWPRGYSTGRRCLLRLLRSI
jgi:hypothetical protein